MNITPLGNLPETRTLPGLEYVYSWLSGKQDTTKRGYFAALRDFILTVHKSPIKFTTLDVCLYCLNPQAA